MFPLLKKYWISITVNSLVFAVCMMKPPGIEVPTMTDFDKLVHFFLFLGISGTAFFDNTGYLKRKSSALRIFNGSFLFPVAFGGLIEILQATLTNIRSGDWMDFLYDAIGALAGVVICLIINRKLK